MIRRSTWIMVLVFVIVLGGALYWQRSRQGVEAGGTPTAAVSNLFDTEAQDINVLQLSDAEGNRVEVARGAGDTWTLVEPAGQPADETRINSAVLEAEGLRIVSSLEDPPQLDVIGLEPPRYRLAVTLADGQEQVAFIGDGTPTESGYYARRDGGPVVVVVKPAVDAILDLLTTPPIALTPTLTGTVGITGTATILSTEATAVPGTTTAATTTLQEPPGTGTPPATGEPAGSQTPEATVQP
jgi:hypothetical protein